MEKISKLVTPSQLSPLDLFLSDVTDLLGLSVSSRRGRLSRADYQFVRAVAEGERLEVALGKLAAQQATLSSVRLFGEQMVRDHGQVGGRLQQIAEEQGALWPTEPAPDQVRRMESLGRRHGHEFDREYVAFMLSHHKHDFRAFQRAARRADHPELRRFADGTSFLIQHHLQMAKYLAEQVRSEIRYRH